MGGASDVDVVVIGGGLAGTATLRELAWRGVRAVLLEASDLCSGGSLLAAGTIDVADLLPSRADRALRERESEILAASARHLCGLVPVLALAEPGRRGLTALARWDALLALRARSGGASATVLDASAVRAREPAIVIDDDRGALLDRRLRIDATRIALAYARDAIEHGAEVRLRSTVRSFAAIDGGVRVTTTDASGSIEIAARALVIATGASPEPGSAVPTSTRTLQLVLDHAITTHAVVSEGESLVPFHALSIATGRAVTHAAASSVARDEVRALVQSLGRVVPELRDARIVDTRACVRRSDDSREDTPPVFRVARGTPWDARARGEAIARSVTKHLGIEDAIDTRTAKLPGGEEAVDSFEVAERLAMPEAAARRIALRHGARSIDIGARIGRRRTEAAVVCACDPVLEAEVRHAVRAELAQDVGDVCRRTQLGLAACGGMRCAHRAAEIVAAERALAPSEVRTMARRFLAERWQARAPGLDASSLAQEELARARWNGASGLDDADVEPSQ
jgi:glycerol-3-phosphate dehydrogenase